MSENEGKRPRRRFVLKITIGADTWEDAAREMYNVAQHVEEHGPKCNSVSGGYSTGHIVDVNEDPEMTHERFVEELSAHLGRSRR